MFFFVLLFFFTKQEISSAAARRLPSYRHREQGQLRHSECRGHHPSGAATGGGARGELHGEGGLRQGPQVPPAGKPSPRALWVSYDTVYYSPEYTV